jgi:hypothetical protein
VLPNPINTVTCSMENSEDSARDMLEQTQIVNAVSHIVTWTLALREVAARALLAAVGERVVPRRESRAR